MSGWLSSRAAASLARVVRVPNFLSQDEIALVRRLERAHHERLAHPPPARRGWHTTYLSAGGLFRAAAPVLHRRLGELRYKVDLSPFVPAGGPEQPPSSEPSASEQLQLLRGLEARCIELHEGRAGGSLNDPHHFDNGSVVTVDVMLDDGFTGGQLPEAVTHATEAVTPCHRACVTPCHRGGNPMCQAPCARSRRTAACLPTTSQWATLWSSHRTSTAAHYLGSQPQRT